MIHRKLISAACVAAASMAVVVGSFAVAEPSKDAKPTDAPAMQLPPGWTQADMEACIVAGMPGKMHEHLAKGVGKWYGKSTMWMYPGAEPIHSETTATFTPMFDGRYFRLETSGEMPGMGPFNGYGLYGYDNVAQKFVATWIDNHSSGMMHGTGELASDGSTINWTYSYQCPITKKPTTMREVEKETGPNTKTLDMYAFDPKSGKEFQMMKLELTRK